MSAPDLIIRGALWGAEPKDLLIRKGKVLELKPYSGTESYSGGKVVDAKGLTLLPSCIDCHVHLREPGFEYKEDIASGLNAAAHGGFGTIMCMANTSPVNDSASVTRYMLTQAKAASPRGPRLRPVGALTRGLQAKELSLMGELADAGCVAFSNDGLPVSSSELFRRAMEYAADLGLKVIDHCEDPTLAPEWTMNESALSGRLGLKGQPSVGESMQVARDILLASYLDIPIHLAHVSTRQSVELIAWAKQKGMPVTAETCAHYLLLNEEAASTYDSAARVSPPLRGQDDMLALRQALREGVIDILVTDHAPHAAHEKEVPFEEAPNGISGLDTALSLYWEMVETRIIDRETLIRAASAGPAAIFNLPVCSFRPGDPADFLLFDAEARWTLTPESMLSKGKNTPFMGRELRGKVKHHYMEGKPLF